MRSEAGSAEHRELIKQMELMELRLSERMDRIEGLLREWVTPTISERNRQILTAPREVRKAANKELYARKRRELKDAQKKQ